MIDSKRLPAKIPKLKPIQLPAGTMPLKVGFEWVDLKHDGTNRTPDADGITPRPTPIHVPLAENV